MVRSENLKPTLQSLKPPLEDLKTTRSVWLSVMFVSGVCSPCEVFWNTLPVNIHVDVHVHIHFHLGVCNKPIRTDQTPGTNMTAAADELTGMNVVNTKTLSFIIKQSTRESSDMYIMVKRH